MAKIDVSRWQHSHAFHQTGTEGERRTWLVIAITAFMMVFEIAGGIAFGSMALLADGWHMSTHVAALGIAVFAYRFARKQAGNPAFAFGTGKVGVLGGFTSAIVLAVVALLVMVECIERAFSPVSIQFDEALAIAGAGLLINLISAFLLKDKHDHHHHGGGSHEQHDHSHGPHEHHHREDHGAHDHAGVHEHQEPSPAPHTDLNRRAAYLHVLADALTSVTAIVALLLGKMMNWQWIDPAVGALGSIVIARWSYSLLRDTGAILLDSGALPGLREKIRDAIEGDSDARVADLHLWQVAPGRTALILSVVAHAPRPASEYRARVCECVDLAHITIEVHAAPG